ncbi:hypothetical protein HEK616_43680 [Streptomyces nigrescens]|uniref:Uncharacterized protein n=1 Tax=Streptomyces nigrescens TaxID=1920 RepID=A0ABM7ZWZ0_STRNI|nr:hypothetical protein HEK616_43680 [Streptomyces nigrescens]
MLQRRVGRAREQHGNDPYGAPADPGADREPDFLLLPPPQTVCTTHHEAARTAGQRLVLTLLPGLARHQAPVVEEDVETLRVQQLGEPVHDRQILGVVADERVIGRRRPTGFALHHSPIEPCRYDHRRQRLPSPAHSDAQHSYPIMPGNGAAGHPSTGGHGRGARVRPGPRRPPPAGKAPAPHSPQIFR